MSIMPALTHVTSLRRHISSTLFSFNFRDAHFVIVFIIFGLDLLTKRTYIF